MNEKSYYKYMINIYIYNFFVRPYLGELELYSRVVAILSIVMILISYSNAIQ